MSYSKFFGYAVTVSATISGLLPVQSYAASHSGWLIANDWSWLPDVMRGLIC